MSHRTTSPGRSETKLKLVDAGIELMRARGFSATTVDHICAAAGVTKGGFFHYFKSKEEIAKVALTQFHEGKAKDYEEAAFRKFADPLDRVFGRLDFVEASIGGGNHRTKGCLIGVFAQELAFNNPELREACQGFFTKIIEDFAKDLTAAKTAHVPKAKFDPKSIARLYLSVIQGSLMLAKVAGNNDALTSNIEEFRNYLQNIFGLAERPATPAQAKASRPVLN